MSKPEIPSVGRFSAAHGRAKSVGTEVVFEAVPDGVHPADPAPAATGPRPGGRPFDSQTARTAALRRHALAKVPDFVRKELEYVPAKDFAPFDEGRRGLMDAKIAEVVAMTGCSGVGVSTTVRGYAWLVSMGEFFAVRFAKTGSEEDAERSRKFFKDASIELAKAHELARAEAAARRDTTPTAPWLVAGKDGPK